MREQAGFGRRKLPTLDNDDELETYLQQRSNWGRWGRHDQRGTVNLCTPEKVVEGTACVRHGRAVSLARPISFEATAWDPSPAQLQPQRRDRPDGSGIALDHVAMSFHGLAATHLDALCHVWVAEGMYGGQSPDEVLTRGGATFGDVDQWADGLMTRGVLLDVPAHRGVDHVIEDAPVTGQEMSDIAERLDLDVRPGDALVVRSGRTAWERSLDSEAPYPQHRRPGLDASCLAFLREYDIGVLVWDMMEQVPSRTNLPFSVHAALYAFGLPLVDNAELERLSVLCAELRQREFLFSMAPLRLIGASGSPVNPLAVL